MLWFGSRAKLKRILNLAAQTPSYEKDSRKYHEHLEQIRSLIDGLQGKLSTSALPLIKEGLIDRFGPDIIHSALQILNRIEEGDIEREMLDLAERFGCTADALRLLAPRNPARYFPQLDPEKRFLAFVDAVEQKKDQRLLLQYLELAPEGVNLRHDGNQSLLWYAIGSKNQELAQFLLDRNIDVHLVDARRETIFDYCRERMAYQRCQVSQWFMESHGHREAQSAATPQSAPAAPSSSTRLVSIGEEFQLYGLIRRMESGEWLPLAEGETLDPTTHSVCYKAYQEANTLDQPEQLQGLCRLVKLGVLSPQQVGLAGMLFGILLSRLDDRESRAVFLSLFTNTQGSDTMLIGLLRGARKCGLKEVAAFARDCLNHDSYGVRAEACAYLVRIRDEQGISRARELVESGKLRTTEARKLSSLDGV